jgi:hypothetical protein
MSPSSLARRGRPTPSAPLALILFALVLAAALGCAAHHVVRADAPRVSADLPLQLVPLVVAPVVHALLAR